ncbi:MAG: hypothetical protein IJP43_01800 [Oscillospiraceae bacterium]|nr:hypothetical protein [Oscillospiraceae bacterium]
MKLRSKGTQSRNTLPLKGVPSVVDFATKWVWAAARNAAAAALCRTANG